MRLVSTATCSDMPPPSALLGTASSAALIEAINQKYQPDYFGSELDPLRQMHAAFMQMVIIPANIATEKIEAIGATVKSAPGVTDLMRSREYIVLSTVDAVINAPGTMQAALLFDPNIRKYHDAARIGGWGIDTSGWIDDDPYHTSLTSGYVPDVGAAFAKTNGDLMISCEWHSDANPLYDLDPDEAHSVRISRQYVLDVLSSSDIDPTTGLQQG